MRAQGERLPIDVSQRDDRCHGSVALGQHQDLLIQLACVLGQRAGCG